MVQGHFDDELSWTGYVLQSGAGHSLTCGDVFLVQEFQLWLGQSLVKWGACWLLSLTRIQTLLRICSLRIGRMWKHNSDAQRKEIEALLKSENERLKNVCTDLEKKSKLQIQ